MVQDLRRFLMWKKANNRLLVSLLCSHFKRSTRMMSQGDSCGVKLATDAVQAQEKLHMYMRNNKHQHSEEAYSTCGETLDQLRSLKSEIEGSHVKFEKIQLNKKILQDKVRPDLLMNVPGTMTTEVKQQLTHNIEQAFQGSCKRLVFAGLLTCPWYWCTQEDRGLQAKHNDMFVVYQYKEEQVFSVISQHQNEQNQVLDEGWFYAYELQHFMRYVNKGSVRFAECLFLPDSAVIYQSPEFLQLKHCVELQHIIDRKSFVQQCCGQAVGSVSRKVKKGPVKVTDTATLYNFCRSFRLLHHAERALSNSSLVMTRVTGDDMSPRAKQCLQQLTDIYQAEETSVKKEDLFESLMRWKSEVDASMKTHKFVSPEVVEDSLKTWLYGVRTAGRSLKPLDVVDSERDRLQSLLQTFGGSVTTLRPHQILLIARAGSYLYGLNTPQSDVDYIIVYAETPENVLGGCRKLAECSEHRGPHLDFEYGVYEARLFTEMLWKGSVLIQEVCVLIQELVFADSLEYSSDLWRQLTTDKRLFLTERAISQYFGLIKNNMAMIEKERFKGEARERKLFYQVFHKLSCLEYFLRAEVPAIRCEGETRDFIMRIRHGPLQDDISREKLYELAVDKTTRLKTRLNDRTERLAENVDYNFLQDWLMCVRGWKETTAQLREMHS